MVSLTSLTTAELIDGRLAPLAVAHGARDPELRDAAHLAAARDLAMTAALTELLAATDQPLLVSKGAAIGPLYYDSPAHRPRLDIDVWVDGWAAAHALAATMKTLGYTAVHQLPGELARHAIAMSRGDVAVDVHAVCSRRVRLARALPFADVWAQRLTVPLGAATMHVPAHHHHWLLCAAHVTAHHAGQTVPLLHLEDLCRIGARCDAEAWTDVARLAREHELGAALAHAVDLAKSWRDDAAPDIAFDATDESASWRHPLLAVLDDLSLLSAADQRRYLGELSYPPSEYLQQHFECSRPRPRALLALHRLLAAAAYRLSEP